MDPNVCYKIEAFQNIANNKQVSFSNTICIEKDSKIFMPNAFNPLSDIEQNRVFKPNYAFVGGSFVMRIYNRTGSKIFETTDINEGWDGKIHGKMVPEGTYQYAIEAIQPSGDIIKKTGAVNLILHEN